MCDLWGGFGGGGVVSRRPLSISLLQIDTGPRPAIKHAEFTTEHLDISHPAAAKTRVRCLQRSKSERKRKPNVGANMGQRHRRWPRFAPTSGQLFLFCACPVLTQCYFFLSTECCGLDPEQLALIPFLASC